MEELKDIILELKVMFNQTNWLGKLVYIITGLVVFPIGILYGMVTLPIKYFKNK